MTRGVPTIDPKMFGDATPEDVARALYRPSESPLHAIRPWWRSLCPTSWATVSRIWQSVSDSRMLCLPANSLSTFLCHPQKIQLAQLLQLTNRPLSVLTG